MPFQSDRQRRWMFANMPRMAQRWSAKGDAPAAEDTGQATCGYTGTIAGGRIVWVMCDRGRFAANDAERWGWWARDNKTMQMETGDTSDKAKAQRLLRAAIRRMKARIRM